MCTNNKMKTAFPSFLLLASFPWLLSAQGFPGEYFLPADGSEVVLQLEEAGWNQLGGTLTDSDGARFQANAIIEQGEARGTLANQEGGMYFEAYLQGEQLILRIIPADAYNQPDHLNAKEFVLTRRERTKAPITLGRQEPGQEAEAAQPAPEQGLPPGTWEGAYFGGINEVPAGLSISRYGNQLSGQIDAGGYKYILEGAISGNEAWGEVLDPQSQGKMKFSGSLSANLLTLTFSGEKGQSEIAFLSEAARPLLGNWSYAEMASPARPARTRQLLMRLLPDGRFYYGDAGAVSTAPESDGVTRGRWRISNNVLYLLQEGRWKPFAAFQVRGDSLFLRLGNGEVQEWKRGK